MTLASCVYWGEVLHHRRSPKPHRFRYSLFMLYVDLEELPHLFERTWLWSVERWNLAWFRRADHLGPIELPLADAVRQLIAARCGAEPAGRIRLLTHFRYFGFGMNPISLYYCFDRAERLEFVVAEVTNTPWGEQHCYVLDVRRQTQLALHGQAIKQMHVSPFMPMEVEYRFAFSAPGETLSMRIEHGRAAGDGPTAFDATLRLTRRPFDRRQLAAALCRFPAMTFQVFTAIYWEALRLWLKRIPYVPHPRSRSAESRRLG